MNVYIKDPSQKPQACVIWMHGLGADAHDMLGLAEQLPLPVAVRHVSVEAPIRPVTLNNNMPMRAWYNIVGKTLVDREDSEGISQSEASICKVIDSQLQEGFEPKQIFLAGFSQGGAVALITGLHATRPLGGIIALSTYLPIASVGQIQLDKQTPIFFASGQHDPLVLPLWGSLSVESLREYGFEQITWHEYPMEHAVCKEEVMDLTQWLTTQIAAISPQQGGMQ